MNLGKFFLWSRKINSRPYKKPLVFLTAFLGVELFSFLAFLFPLFGKVFFVVIVLLAIFLTIKNLEYGLLLLFAELITGSKGYLFFYEWPQFTLSIRIALFLTVMTIFFVKNIYFAVKTKACPILAFFRNDNFKYFLPLFLFIIFAFANGFWNHNGFSNIYQDVNGWFYFVLLFPLYYVYENKNDNDKRIFKDKIIALFLLATFWLALKTFILLFIFSHNSVAVMTTVYKWVRDTGVGEITRMDGGFVRIFFQSHIFAIVAFFITLFLVVEDGKVKIKNSILLIAYAAIIILSYSRSNWLGFVAGFAFYLLILIVLKSWSKLGRVVYFSVGALFLAFVFINFLIIFPYPKTTASFNPADIAERASQISNEAGVSSRWKLLPPLWAEVKKHIFVGGGYGATVTYFSADPRVLANNPTGEYTTFAFEWGWLEIWLKLGIFGVLYYLFLLTKLTVVNLYPRTLNLFFVNRESVINLAWIIGLITISVISFFSPYLNHPLGIGYLLLMSIFVEKNPQKTT